jgi:hypothetical protein
MSLGPGPDNAVNEEEQCLALPELGDFRPQGGTFKGGHHVLSGLMSCVSGGTRHCSALLRSGVEGPTEAKNGDACTPTQERPQEWIRTLFNDTRALVRTLTPGVGNTVRF